ncbi:MAG: glycosyltransferase family 4 protein [Pseudomonadales bacterium]|nr:glycosyltransferase family 4 protein [Pseudomonadales bacterium]MBO7004765.1 glycosyltransferase family 4 protein [Pseudomonadales bacterium]
MKLCIAATHPVQYHAPLFRLLARELDLFVLYQKGSDAEQHERSDFEKSFEWDTNLLEGYKSKVLAGGIDKEIARQDCDAILVLGWHSSFYWKATFSGIGNNIPVLVRGDSHLLTPTPIFKRLLKLVTHRLLLLCFDAALYSGVRSREYFSHYGMKDEQLFFSPNSVDNQFFFKQSASGESLRDELGIPAEEKVVLFAGKLVEDKNPHLFSEAIVELNHADKGRIHGVVVGDGRLRQQLMSRYSDESYLHFPGFRNQSQMPACYASADLLCLPSKHETWGLVVNEAMATGLPCLVTDTAGCVPDLITKETGMTLSIDEMSALAAKIALALERTWNRDAIRHAISGYDLNQTARGIVEACTYAVNRK